MPDFATPALTMVPSLVLALMLAGAVVLHWRHRRLDGELERRVREAGERVAVLQSRNAELAKDRDLFLRMQRFGKTGYIVSDIARDRVYWSDSLFELRRVPRREYFTFDEAVEFLHPDDRARYMAVRTAAVAERRDWEIDNRIQRGDGTVSWEHAIGRPQFDAAGNLAGALVILQDITDRKAREEENQRLSLVATHTTNSVIISSFDGRIEWVNEAFTRFTGYSLAEARGQRALDLLRGPASDPDAIALARERLGRGEGFRDVEMLNYTKSGEPYWVNVEVQPNRDSDGKVVQFVSIGTNITARKAAEAEIKASHDRFAGAFHGSTDAMGVATIGAEPGSGIVDDVNEAAERLFGLRRDELVGRSLFELADWVDRDQLLEYARRLRSEGLVRDYPSTLRRRDGSTIEILITASRFVAAGKTYVIFIIRDVTEARLAERKILELNESLEADHRLLRAIADTLPVGIVYRDAEGRYRFMNRTAEEWLAVNFKSAAGKKREEVIPEDYLRSTAQIGDRIQRGSGREEATIRYPDGKVRTVDTTYVQDVDPAGRLRGHIVLSVDISERKAAELAVEESRARFAGAFHSSNDSMALYSLKPEIGGAVALEVNEAAMTLFGLPRDQIVGLPIGSTGIFADADDMPKFRAALSARSQLRNLPVRMRHSSGRIVETLINASQFTVGDQSYVLVVGRDVTEARAAERKIHELNESLAASLRQLRAIADNLPAAVVHLDAERRYTFLNRTAQRWLAITAEAAIGKTLAEAMPDKFATAIAAGRDRLIRGDRRQEVTVRYPDGVTRTVEVASIPDVDADGLTRGYYIFAIDLSERKAMEEQLRQSQKLEAIGKLTGGVAHDFNNLLAVISGNLELADEALVDREDVRKVLRPALRATERGAALTQSLLAYARQQPLSPSAVDPSALIRDMSDLLRRTIPANIGFELEVGKDLWKCEVDPGQLQNALLNLVLNARDAMPSGGRLTIEIANAPLDDDYAAAQVEVAPGNYVMLAVSDTGSGMAPDVVARAFEPFFTTKEVGRGTGLGLSMVYGFAKQSRGHVNIYSEEGRGTTVRIYLPRAGDRSETPSAVPTSDEIAARGETILVVEDDPNVRSLALSILRSLGYEVLEAADAGSALTILEKAPTISLMLTDLGLPGGMNGRQLAERMAVLRPQAKVLYMSGYTENAIVHDGRLDRGVNFLQKPFRKQDLARKIRHVLGEMRKS